MIVFRHIPAYRDAHLLLLVVPLVGLVHLLLLLPYHPVNLCVNYWSLPTHKMAKDQSSNS